MNKRSYVLCFNIPQLLLGQCKQMTNDRLETDAPNHERGAYVSVHIKLL